MRVQLMAPHGWGDPAGRVDTLASPVNLPWREPGVVERWLVSCV